MVTFPSTDSTSRNWPSWAVLLVALYIIVSLAGWGRTLIGNEVWAMYYAGRPLGEQMQSIRNDLVHPPLMYLVERAWLAVFGHTDSSVKALPLVLNIPTIVLFTWLAASITRYWRLASFLFASIYLEVNSSPTQVRMYGLGLLLTVIGIILWEKWRARPNSAVLAAWATTMVLLVYTHLFGSLIVMAFVIADWLCGTRRIAFTAAAAGVGVAMFPWLVYIYPVWHSRGLEPNVAWVGQSTLRGVAELPLIFMGTPPIPLARGFLALAGVLLHLLLLALGWKAIRRLWPPRPGAPTGERWLCVGLVLTGVPILILFLFSEFITPSFHPRFILGVLPSYWLSLVLLGEFGGRLVRGILYGVFIPWVLISAGANLVQQRKPSPVRQVAVLLAQEAFADDLILCNGRGGGNALDWEWKHLIGRTSRLEIVAVPLTQDEFAGPPQISLDALDLNGLNRVWVFYEKGDASAIDNSRVTEFLASHNFKMEKALPAEKPTVQLFVRINSP
jgi:hypothetical protein